MTDFNTQIEALLTAQADNSSVLLEQLLQNYDVNDIVAVLAKRSTTGGGPVVTPGNDVTGTPTQDGMVVNQQDAPFRLIAGGHSTDAHPRTVLTGNGLLMFGDGSDDPSGFNSDLYFDSTDGLASDGYLSVGKGIIFPTSDPHITGAWWDNAGTLTKSSG